MSPGYTRVLFDGQSLNFAPVTLNGSETYPAQTMVGVDAPWEAVGISGTSWTVLATTAANRLHSRLQVPRPVLVLNGGQTDLGTDGDTGAQALADVEAYADAARTAALGDAYVIACTVPPASMMSGGEEIHRQTYNAGILTSGHFDAVADVGAVPQLQNYNDVTYFYDTIHWTAAGAQLAADLVRPLIVAAAA